jgi:3-isopropylmalate dehydrogenase
MKIAVLPGDGIGTEIVAEAVKVLNVLDLPVRDGIRPGRRRRLRGPRPPPARIHPQAGQGGRRRAVRRRGRLEIRQAGPPLRPEQAILGLRKNLGLFANFRPAICYEQLVGASSLKPELIAGLDILIIRELTGDIYFGQPRGRRTATDGHFPGAEEAFDTMRYSKPEIERIAHVAFQAARKRSKRSPAWTRPTCWRPSSSGRTWSPRCMPAVPRRGAGAHVRGQRRHAAGQGPKAFDVVVTGNMFGDILSDEASMLTGSIGMLPSASLNSSNQGLYEPSHGSAPDIAGKGIANPLATILSAAMMLRFSLNQEEAAQRIEAAVQKVLAQGLRTPGHLERGHTQVGTAQMGDAVVKALG